MKKTIQKITGLIALLACLVGACPAFATQASQGSHREGDGFFSINMEFPLHFGFTSFVKFPIKHVINRLAGGIENGLGPFIEWKPLNGIAIQVGALYTRNYLFTNGKTIFGTGVYGWSGISNPNVESSSDVDAVKFSTFSIPLSIRLYPGDARQFALHAGLRFVIPIGTPKRLSLEPNGIINDNSNDNLVKRGCDFFFKGKPGYALKIASHCTLDFGFDYNSANSGLIIGMNGLGLSIGYDFTKLFIKA